MAREPATPFDKIITVGTTLDLYVEHGDIALGEQTPREFAAQVREAFGYLLDFRNLVNGMVGLDEAPGRAVLHYIKNNDILEAAAELGE